LRWWKAPNVLNAGKLSLERFLLLDSITLDKFPSAEAVSSSPNSGSDNLREPGRQDMPSSNNPVRRSADII
jgi:hypothetical protein